MLILLLLLALLVPFYFLQKVLQRWLQPRLSLGRLMLYLLVMLALVFGYTFLLVWLTGKLFPLA
ncbi:MAG: hypothetical protein QM781_07960 [Chitinophagaceae bacterium]